MTDRRLTPEEEERHRKMEALRRRFPRVHAELLKTAEQVKYDLNDQPFQATFPNLTPMAQKSFWRLHFSATGVIQFLLEGEAPKGELFDWMIDEQGAAALKTWRRAMLCFEKKDVACQPWHTRCARCNTCINCAGGPDSRDGVLVCLFCQGNVDPDFVPQCDICGSAFKPLAGVGLRMAQEFSMFQKTCACPSLSPEH